MKNLLKRFIWLILSVPIYIKILGIGLLVTFLFGSVAFYQIRVGMYYTHYQVHGQTALSVALALAEQLDPLIEADNLTEVDYEVNHTMASFPDVRYIVVQDGEGKIISHGFTFPKEAPPDLASSDRDLCSNCHSSLSPKELPSGLLEVPPRMALPQGRLRAYSRPAGLILEVTVPISEGDKGMVRLGVGDKIIAHEIASITRSLLLSLALCALVGLSLALVLAWVLVRPILNLVQATQRIRKGDFSARAHVYSADEIGRLASVFNQMADGLEQYRCEVHEKEQERVSLLGRIVQAQEEERKLVSRELHDQLGQSLSNALLTIESSCRNCPSPKHHCGNIKENIRELIDEVRQLAWDVRPSIIDDYGLDRALNRYIGEISERADFSIDYQFAAPPDAQRPDDSLEITLFRVTQEAVTNIIRHSEASRASVVLMQREKELSLIIEDDGRGFSPDSVQNGEKPPLGLIGMRERVALVGGSLVVDSAPDKGTTIRVTIPTNGEYHGHTDSDSR